MPALSAVQLGWLALGASAVGTAAGVKGQLDAKSDASKQRRLQEEQARLQERISATQMRRQQRLRAAQMIARGGAAGVGGGVMEGALVAGQTSTGANIDLLGQQTGLQIDQFRVQEQVTRAQANANIAGALGTFSAKALTEVPDLLGASKPDQGGFSPGGQAASQQLGASGVLPI